MNTSEFTDITLERRDRVAIITLDRPGALNAVRTRTLVELGAVLDLVALDPDIRCLVLTGAGRAFCAGQDLSELDGDLAEIGMSASLDDVRARLEPYQSFTRRLMGLRVPSIAAINGLAVGLGTEIAVACDLRLAVPTARIGFVEASRALFQTNGVLWLLPRLVGHGRSLQLLLGGQLIDADEAHRIGLVNDLADDVLVAALELAEIVASNAPISIRALRDVMRVTWELDIDAVMELEVQGVAACLASADLREGTAAFLERRIPNYRGI
ncbi:MAG: enoyl-CoA hydratase/isomerase family protein [Actinobacteria bacterium]|nr:enoyl-CoA hydratase/isomerase family protein [Actinomycetota bacterium]